MEILLAKSHSSKISSKMNSKFVPAKDIKVGDYIARRDSFGKLIEWEQVVCEYCYHSIETSSQYLGYAYHYIGKDPTLKVEVMDE